jgi:Flp pilus assembly protein TadD
MHIFLRNIRSANTLLAVCALLAVLTTPLSARADDYADVSKLASAGQFSEALAKADQYLTSKARDPHMRFIKGVVLAAMGRSADAMTIFQQLIEDYPELPEPYNNLAVLYAAQKQFDKARASLEMAIRNNPAYATAHENLGDVYMQLANQSYNKALQLDASKTGIAPKLAMIRSLLEAAPKASPAAANPKPATPRP